MPSIRRSDVRASAMVLFFFFFFALVAAAAPTSDNVVASFFLIASSRLERKLTYSVINVALSPPAIVTNQALLDSGLTWPSGLAVNPSTMRLYVADPGAHAVLALRLKLGSEPAAPTAHAAHAAHGATDSLGAAASSKPSLSQQAASLVPFLAPIDDAATVPTLSVVGSATTLMSSVDASFLAVDPADGSLVVTTDNKGVLRFSADALAVLETADPTMPPPQIHIVDSATLTSARKTAAAVGDSRGDSDAAVLAALGLPQSAVIVVRLLDMAATGVAVSERRLLLGSPGGTESLVLATDLGATATPTQIALSHHAAARGVAVSAGGGGALFVASATAGSLFRADLLRPGSTPITITDMLQDPQQVAVDGQGTVLVADSAASTVWSYSAGAARRTNGELIVRLNGVFGLAVLPTVSEGAGVGSAAGSAGSASCAVAVLAMVVRSICER